MTKFDELCKAFARARKDYHEYENSSRKFAGKLVKKLIDHMGIPKDQFKYVPLEGERDKNATYSIAGAMHLDHDAYWNLGICITIYEQPNSYPHQPLLIRLLFKKKDDSYIVKIGPNGDVNNVRLDVEEDYAVFAEFLFNYLKNIYEGRLEKFLEKDIVEKKIGF